MGCLQLFDHKCNYLLYLSIYVAGKDDDFALCNVSKSLIIDRPPKILVLHIKRFYLEPVVRKDNEHVSFTKDLNITSYCTTDYKKVLMHKNLAIYIIKFE